MSINKNNYETYLIDYLDGKLTPVEVSEVLLFLELHPEIKAEFEGLEFVNVKEAPVSFDASFLKKPAYAEVAKNYEQLLIAELEGDLSDHDRIALQEAKGVYPELNRDALLFAKTRIVPEEIHFLYKKELKKPAVVPLYRQTWIRIAAVLLVIGFAGLTWVNFNTLQLPDQQHTASTPQQNATTHSDPLKMATEAVTARPVTAGRKENLSQPNERLQQTIRRNNTTEHPVSALWIASIPPASMQSSVALSIPPLMMTDQYLEYAVPSEMNGYTDLRELAVQKIEKEKAQLLGTNEDGKTLSLFEAINKATGDNIKVDTSETGKIKRFEVAGLGFEWSHSK